jgi:hypothetical protein
MQIPDYVSIRDGILIRNGQPLAGPFTDPADMYRRLGYNYPKFFKMDTLCKWAWLAAEALLREDEGTYIYEGLDKQSIAMIMATRDGCLDVDHRYQESMLGISSPALFVYTLPNIMLGEICIRHGFTGEQLCEVQEDFDAEALLLWVRDLMADRSMSHCLFGWADAINSQQNIMLFWSDKKLLANLAPDQLQIVHNKPL